MTTETREKVTIVTRKDLDVSYFIGSGAGGQNKQKNHTGVQIIHRASGAIGRCSETRSREQNQKTAFRRMHETPKFKVWLSAKLYEIRMGETLEERVNREVDKQMADHNLKIETF